MNSFLLFLILAFSPHIAQDPASVSAPRWTPETVHAALTTLDAIEDGLRVLASEHPLLSLSAVCPEQKGANGLDRAGLRLTYQNMPPDKIADFPAVLVIVTAVEPGVLDSRFEGDDRRFLLLFNSRAGTGYHVFVYAQSDDDPDLADTIHRLVISAASLAPQRRLTPACSGLATLAADARR